MKRQTLSVLLMVLFLGTGCAYTDRTSPAEWSVRRARLAAQVYAGAGGDLSQWDEVLNACVAADVVIIGEMHGHERGLAVTGALWQDISARSDSAALALEFVERDAQVWLDDYTRGLIDAAALAASPAAAAAGDHKPLVDWAKANGLRVYAANAPRRYAGIARIDGWEGLHTLTPTQRSTFVLPAERTDAAYRERFDKALADSGLKHQDGTAADYMRSQELWDATMADTLASAVKSGHRPVVLVVGRFHSDFNGGVMQYLRRKLPAADLLTVSLIDVAGGDSVDVGRADWVLDVGERDEAAR